MHDGNDPIDEGVQHIQTILADSQWRNDRRLCGTMLLMSGQIQSRPEVDAVEPELKAVGCAAVPSWRKDGTWESWVRVGNITGGPSETFPTREAALEAGRAHRDDIASLETTNPAEAGSVKAN
jgi:hypothetical protein